MADLSALLGFAAISLGMVLTPGPNMVYLLSRSICQGRAAGVCFLVRVASGFAAYMLWAALGITAIAWRPHPRDAIRDDPTTYVRSSRCGTQSSQFPLPMVRCALRALYRLSLPWQAVRPGGRSPFQIRDLPRVGLR